MRALVRLLSRFAWWLRPVEEHMIGRLLRQRDEAWREADYLRHALKENQR